MPFDNENNANSENPDRQDPAAGQSAAERRDTLQDFEERAMNGEMTLAGLEEVLRIAVRRSVPVDAEDKSLPVKRETSALRSAASALNGRKSRGPITGRGKQIAWANLRQPRLRGLAEAKTLDLDLEAAEKLYRELIAPYESEDSPAPALLALHFQDLARLELEVQALERIRDATLEYRAEQIDLESRRLRRDVRRQLPGTAKELFTSGLHPVQDFPAKFKRQYECFGVLKGQLLRRDFDMGPILHMLYGKDLDPSYDRAQSICLRCERLMNPKDNEPLTESEFQRLLQLVTEEERDALNNYILRLDEMSISRSAALARLAPTREDRYMDRRGEQLRRAIDRKQRVITTLLKLFGLTPRTDAGRSKTSGVPARLGAAKNPPSIPRHRARARRGLASGAAPIASSARKNKKRY